ncbi:MAG: hypothetical protein OEY89_01240 [Gammaproteobacteria bacterium]|nr:hypothetical protein [Gammaproteobacteria bacterium]
MSRTLCLGMALVFLSACASYSQSFSPVERNLFDNDPAKALETLDKQDYPKRDMFLYYSNKALLLRMLGQFSESNKQLELAKNIITEFSATSVSEESSAFIINDATRSYIGSPVEQIMLHIYAALNYLELNDRDAARVEVLQVDIRLKELTQENPDSALSIDPFAHYLSGIIYEDLHEWSDALIAYRKSYEAYLSHNQLYTIAVPLQLKQSLILMSHKVGIKDELNKYEKEFEIKLSDLISKNPGSELVFIFHNGLAPIKREHAIQVLSPVSGKFIRIALPSYESRSNFVAKAKININNEISQTTELAEDIASLQIKTLQQHTPAITARAIARAVAKYKIADNAGDQSPVAGLLVNVIGLVTERADTRSWLTLPAEIQVARIKLPAGEYRLDIELLNDSDNMVMQPQSVNIRISDQHKHYLSWHRIANTISTRH